MSGSHAHALYVHEHSWVHEMAPQCKLIAQLLFVFIVVATPREAIWAFLVYGVILAGVAVLARLPAGFVARRLVFELPFVGFALLLPFFGSGPRVEVLGMSLSVAGLWAMWNILAKATLGVAASVILAATTTTTDLLRGLDRLHMPPILTQIASFMIRYTDVISDELQRMKIARESRGYDPRWIWQVKAIAQGAAALFIRSYERGERVYLAMVSRGYAGQMPVLQERAVATSEWMGALALPGVALLICIAAWMGIRA